ncbi:MAG: zf-HC2 domain-containing protein [Gammaproteobacteria bacterium]|nr:zf-HC2 domain-containing protein [Gammaproteobacteria bacterium]
MMNCKHATQLMSQSQDQKLTLKERTFLKLHLLMCSGCSNYKKQISFIHNAMQQFRDR